MAGVLTDLDHLIDYFKNHGFTLNPRNVYNACLEIRFKTLYLVFHSYEIVIALWAAIFALSLSSAWKALAIGITQHIIFDQITNPINGLGYFFVYRAMKGFDKDLFVRCPQKEQGNEHSS